MKRSRFAWFGVALLGLAMHASAQTSPTAPAASAASAPLTRADITPGTQCGQRAVGWQLDVGVVERADAGWRVDGQGIWRPCLPCPPAKAEAFREWVVGANRCTTATSHDTNAASPARDRVIPHGMSGYWRQWTGPSRGHLIEACHDGARTVVASTCEPATVCDSLVEHEGYVYDGRQPGAAVPLGATVQMRRADGSTWPARCVGGDWVVDETRPRQALQSTSAPPVRPVGCAKQTFLAKRGLQAAATWRYDGPRAEVGSSVDVMGPGGAVVRAVCTSSGRLALQ